MVPFIRSKTNPIEETLSSRQIKIKIEFEHVLNLQRAVINYYLEFFECCILGGSIQAFFFSNILVESILKVIKLNTALNQSNVRIHKCT